MSIVFNFLKSFVICFLIYIAVNDFEINTRAWVFSGVFALIMTLFMDKKVKNAILNVFNSGKK